MKSIITLDESKRLFALETSINKGHKTFVEVGSALLEIRESKLYRADYDTFEEYCLTKWGWGHRRSNQLIQAAAVVEALPKNLGTIVPNEGVARELGKLPVPTQEKILAEAVESGIAPTAKSVAQSAPPKAPPPTREEIKTPPAPPIAKSKPPVAAMKDKTGWPIPEPIIELWMRADIQAREMLAEVGVWKVQFEKWQTEKDVIRAGMNCNSIFADLKNAWTSMKEMLPHAVCTSCQGLTPDSCTLCLGRGFISEFKYNNAVSPAAKQFRQNLINKKS